MVVAPWVNPECVLPIPSSAIPGHDAAPALNHWHRAIGEAMQNMVKINDQITVGPQPTEAQLKELQNEGFKTIINFRTEGEEEQPLSPKAEAKEIEKLGMQYLHIPISMKSITPETVDRLRRDLDELSKPVFAHCRLGKRAALMVIMHIASEQGMSGAQAIEKAETSGFKPDKAETEQFVKG
jgi:uncharacterized protein (TIGR01244 family)